MYEILFFKYEMNEKRLNLLYKHWAIVHAEDADITDSATLARRKDFDVSPTSVKIISTRYAIFVVNDLAVGFPCRNVAGVA